MRLIWILIIIGILVLVAAHKDAFTGNDQEGKKH